MNKCLFLPLLAALTGAPFSQAQTAPAPQTSSEMRQAQGIYWSVCFGGCIEKAPFAMVKINTITSFSKQRYLLNGTLNVWELVIDTAGNNAIRIYCIEAPGSKAERLGNLTTQIPGMSTIKNNVGLDGTECVTKTYPESTHTHTIEFRVLNPEALNKIQKSLMKALSTGRGETLNLPAADCPAS